MAFLSILLKTFFIALVATCGTATALFLILLLFSAFATAKIEQGLKTYKYATR